MCVFVLWVGEGVDAEIDVFGGGRFLLAQLKMLGECTMIFEVSEEGNCICVSGREESVEAEESVMLEMVGWRATTVG